MKFWRNMLLECQFRTPSKGSKRKNSINWSWTSTWKTFRLTEKARNSSSSWEKSSLRLPKSTLVCPMPKNTTNLEINCSTLPCSLIVVHWFVSVSLIWDRILGTLWQNGTNLTNLTYCLTKNLSKRTWSQETWYFTVQPTITQNWNHSRTGWCTLKFTWGKGSP